MTEAVLRICQNGHFEGIPAIQAAVYKSGTSSGDFTAGEAVPTSVFDVASITKLAATTLVACKLHAQRTLDLDLPVTEVFPETKTSHPGILVRHLLAHSSGLPAWRPFFSPSLTIPGVFPGPPSADGIQRSQEKCRQSVLSTLPDNLPGAQRTYSDTCFILLGFILEELTRQPLDELATNLIFNKANLTATRFHRLGRHFERRGVLPTGATRPRQPAPGQEDLFSIPPQMERQDPGEVDDDNAYALGGVAGHAGLFSTAQDLAQLGALLLQELDGSNHFGMTESLRLFAEPDNGPNGPLRALGFDLISPQGSSTGTRWGRGPQGGLGHLGFTGCALWIDRDRALSAALLSNRVLPGRQHTEPIRKMRPAFFDALVEADESEAL